MDNIRRIGVERLREEAFYGLGTSIAILDSGRPTFGNLRRCADFYPSEGCDDEFGHATEVASLLFGGPGIEGICPMAAPVYIKVLDDRGMGTVKSVSDGILTALDMDVDIINLSLGFFRTEKCPPRLENACKMAFDMGKTVICAAGNDGGRVNWPAALKNTICVGASDEKGVKTSFSSVGEVDFVAPGIDLTVLDINGCSKKASGTSFSAAMVTGVAALIVNRLRYEGRNHFVADDIRGRLSDMAVDVGEEGWDELTGNGVLSGSARKYSDGTVRMKTHGSFFAKIYIIMKDVFCFLIKGVCSWRCKS